MNTYLCAFLLALSVSLPAISEGATIVSSQGVHDREIWTKEGSPYVLTNDHLIVEEGQILTIEPGVTVHTDGAYMQVYGTLIAEGTEEEKVIFTSSLDEDFPTARGVYFYDTSSDSVLEHIDIRNSQDGFVFKSMQGSLSYIDIADSSAGITLEDSDFSIDHLTVSKVDTPVYLFEGSIAEISGAMMDSGGSGESIYVHGSDLLLNDSVISGISEGAAAVRFTDSSGVLERVVIENGEQSIGIAASKSDLTISSSTIRNLKTGMSLSGTKATIAGSMISDNDTGIEVKNAGGPVMSFKEKVTAGILSLLLPRQAHAETGSPVLIKDSYIQHNSAYGIMNVSTQDVDARTNFWGDRSGPAHDGLNSSGKGDRVTDGVNFTPWLTFEDDGLPSCCSNIIFIPGFQASRLDKGGNQLWEPNRNADVEKLYLNEKGEGIDSSITVGETIAKTIGGPLFSKKIYDSFFENLDVLVSSGKINDWKDLPYDWRYPIENAAESLVSEVASMASSSKTRKVSLVTHSNGGLVAKAILAELASQGKEELIDSLIMVAAPQWGTPSVLSSLLHGESTRLGPLGFNMTRKNARKWGENMPGAYNFIPSSEYMSAVSLPTVSFDSSLDSLNDWRKTYGNTIASTEKLGEFLLGKEGRVKPEYSDLATPAVLNEKLITDAVASQSMLAGPSVASSTGIYQIAGWGVSTPSGIKYKAKKSCGIGNLFCIGNSEWELDHEQTITYDGDGTVVSPSALGVTSRPTTDYFIDLKKTNENLYKNFDHATIFEAPPLISLIEKIIVDDLKDPIEFVGTAKPTSKPHTNITASVHSPIDIHAYDKNGNHTGRMPNPDPNSDLVMIEEGIPNSSYEDVGEGKYITLQDLDQPVIKLQGTDTGTFTFKLETHKDASSTVIEFADIPVTEMTKAEITVMPQVASSTLKLDLEGDGITDFTIKPGRETDPQVYLAALKTLVRSLKLDQKVEAQIIKRIDKVIKSVSKEKLRAAGTKLLKFNAKLANSNWKMKKLTEVERAAIIMMINEILDTL